MNYNVLITGSSGFLGKHVCDVFIENGHNVFGVSRSCESKHNHYIIDITDLHKLNNIVSEKSIEIIVHLAGKPIVSDCEKNPFEAFKTNTLGTVSVLESARLNNVDKVISIETDKVYGNQPALTDETSPLNPDSPYEMSKAFAAQLAAFYSSYYKHTCISVRPANLFGPGDSSITRLIPNAIRMLKDGKGIRIYSQSLNMKRDFLYVKDCAKMIYMLATGNPTNRIYNLSNNNSKTISQIADEIRSTLKLDHIPHTIEDAGDIFTEIHTQEIDGRMFVDEFDFSFTPFEEAIKETWDTK